MALPQKVKYMFSLGLAAAAEVAAKLEDHRAWVYVMPVMSSGMTYRQTLDRWTRTREVGESYDSTIKSYKVRFPELGTKYLAWDHEIDIAIKCHAAANEEHEFAGEDEVEEWLALRLPDLSKLREPSGVGYPGG